MARPDKALAKQVEVLLDGLHDETVTDDPLVWLDSPEHRARRDEDLGVIRERLSSFVHVSRAATLTKLLGFGTLLPLATLALLVWTGFPADSGYRFGTWAVLAISAAAFAIAALTVWWSPSISDDINLAFYAIPRGWAFSRHQGEALWRQWRGRYAYLRRGDEGQSIQTRICGYVDEQRRRPFVMFVFYWVEVRVTSHYNSSTKKMETKTERIPHERHGMFVAMPEAQARIRITEVGRGGEVGESIRLEYGALNKAVDIYCRESDELAVRQFLSPAVQEILLELSKEHPGLHLDIYPGHVLAVTSVKYLSGRRGVRLNRDGAGFEERLRPWIDQVEMFRTALVGGLARIAKYND